MKWNETRRDEQQMSNAKYAKWTSDKQTIRVNWEMRDWAKKVENKFKKEKNDDMRATFLESTKIQQNVGEFI